MKKPVQIVVLAAARLYLPLIVLFAFGLLASRPAGSGVGLMAGLAFALMLVLHMLVFGAAAARAAVPPLLSRAILGLGLAATGVGAAVPAWMYSSRLIEGGLFGATIASAALILAAFTGRAPSLRDEDW